MSDLLVQVHRASLFDFGLNHFKLKGKFRSIVLGESNDHAAHATGLADFRPYTPTDANHRENERNPEYAESVCG
jgi:hypothetical protein